MLIAQITDTHITKPGKLLMGLVDTASALERAVSSLNQLDPSPDVTVLTGDLVDGGKASDRLDRWDQAHRSHAQLALELEQPEHGVDAQQIRGGLGLRQDDAGEPRLDLKVAAEAIAATGIPHPRVLEVGCGGSRFLPGARRNRFRSKQTA